MGRYAHFATDVALQSLRLITEDRMRGRSRQTLQEIAPIASSGAPAQGAIGAEYHS